MFTLASFIAAFAASRLAKIRYLSVIWTSFEWIRPRPHPIRRSASGGSIHNISLFFLSTRFALGCSSRRGSQPRSTVSLGRVLTMCP